MSHWRRLSYAISIAVLLTALAYLFMPGVGEFMALPGLLLNGWANLLILMLSENEYPYQISSWVIFSILFYSILIYLALWIFYEYQKENAKGKPR